MKRCGLVVLLCLAGCANPFQSMMYHTPVHQGTELGADVWAQLKTPMPEREVTELLGSPTFRDPFHPYRADYWHSQGTQDERTLTQHHFLVFDRQQQLRRVQPPL